LPPIIQRLNIDPDAWQLAMQPRAMYSAVRWALRLSAPASEDTWSILDQRRAWCGSTLQLGRFTADASALSTDRRHSYWPQITIPGELSL
jgi:hypothetical protein